MATGRTVRIQSGAVYTGETAFEIVEQMRQADFDPPPTVREYIARAAARATYYFDTSLRISAAGSEQELAERFINAAIEKGFAEEVTLS